MAPSKRFNAKQEAMRLYQRLVRKGDYGAAATILGKLMGGDHDAPTKPAPDPLGRDVSKLTDEEFAELSGILDAEENFWRRVNNIPRPERAADYVAPPPAPPVVALENESDDEVVLADYSVDDLEEEP